MADNYQQDIQNYDNLVIPNKVEYEDNYSIKTNFLTLFKYLNIGFSVITIIKKYIDYLKTQINSENIVTEVIQNLFVNKLEFTLDINSELNISKLVTINDKLYKVTKTKNNEYEIIRDDPGWEVNAIIIQCKLLDGTVIYPKIKTFANIVTITTTEPINSNIIVYMV
jgi:hypothetical protein